MSAPSELASLFYMRSSQTPGVHLLPLQLPGVRGFWWAGTFDSLTRIASIPNAEYLTAAGTPTLSIATAWPGELAPYVEFGGTNEYYSRIDDAILSVTGSACIGVWAYLDTIKLCGLINKWYDVGSNARSYRLYVDASGYVVFSVSSDGSAAHSVTATTTTVLDAATWYFLQGRFTAGESAEVRIDNGAWVTTATGNTTIHDSTRAFYLGMDDENSARRLDGRMAQAWLCGYAVPDAVLDYIYTEQAPLFGKA